MKDTKAITRKEELIEELINGQMEILKEAGKKIDIEHIKAWAQYELRFANDEGVYVPKRIEELENGITRLYF